MSLGRLLLAWLLTAAWFVLWEEARRRLAPRGPVRDRYDRKGWFRLHGRLPTVEALLLTLFAALWFGSLGHGGWALLFTLLGLIVEIPARFRFGHRATDEGRRRWLLVALGVVRFVVAGGILAWRLS